MKDQVLEKSYAVELELTKNDEGKETNTFEAVISTPAVDRDEEIVAYKAFDPLPEHMTVDLDHNVETLNIVASGTPYYDDATKSLKFKGKFASTSKAQEVRKLVLEGHIRTMSVRFRRPEFKRPVDDSDVWTIVKAELLNVSFVPIPANPEALVTAAKAAKIDSKDSPADSTAQSPDSADTLKETLAELQTTQNQVNNAYVEMEFTTCQF